MYAGTDPLTRLPIRLRATARTETQARIELGKLLRDGLRPPLRVIFPGSDWRLSEGRPGMSPATQANGVPGQVDGPPGAATASMSPAGVANAIGRADH